MEDTESHASCIVCQLSVYISLLVVLLYLLSFNSKCLYFIKMTGIYLTIILNAVIVCCCWPLYFFGDVAKFTFDSYNVLSAWTRLKIDLRNGDILQRQGPFVFVCNHQSRSIFVDRFNRERAMKSLEECAKKVTSQKLSVLIFPEGTRNHGDGMLEFKKGAFNVAVFAQIPIVPIVISSYKPFYCKDSRYFADSGYVVVEVLEPIETTGKVIEDVPALTDAVRAQMIEVLGRVSKEADEIFSKQRAQNDETKKSN